jgi:hypothetical protein
VGLLFLIVPWWFAAREWKKLENKFWADEHSPTDEGIRQEWETNHIVQMRKRERENSPEGTEATKPSKSMSDDRKRTIVVWTFIAVTAIAYFAGFGYWPSFALGAVVWVALHLMLGIKMKMWA